jgi:hypothetical protein
MPVGHIAEVLDSAIRGQPTAELLRGA